jgi:hypothetical protein
VETEELRVQWGCEEGEEENPRFELHISRIV